MSDNPANNPYAYKQTLAYYQDKGDELYKERLGWLSKFDECATDLTEKQKKLVSLKELKDQEISHHRAIIHHDVAFFDQRINAIKMERQNVLAEFKDAQQLIKIDELLEEFPAQLDKKVPCKNIHISNEMISNQLNIHSCGRSNSKDNLKKNYRIAQKSKQQDQVLELNSKLKVRPTLQDLLKKQIIELKTSQQLQITTMKKQADRLEAIIREVKLRENNTLKAQREIVDQLKKQSKKLEQKHRNLAEKFFSAKRRLKQSSNDAIKQNQTLKQVLTKLQAKVNNEMRVYQKQTKAKQTLIQLKSQDFQQDYKAKKRAKERNLQVLRDNYKKMQQVCIEKVNSLEETLVEAQNKLSEAQSRKEFLVSQLRDQLRILQRKVKEQTSERAKIDQQIKQKLEQDRRRRDQYMQKEEKEQKLMLKNRLIEQAYRKTESESNRLKSKSKQRARGKQNSRQKPNLKKSAKRVLSKRANKGKQDPQSDDSEQQSFEMSDLQNIKKHINQLSDKIGAQDIKH